MSKQKSRALQMLYKNAHEDAELIRQTTGLPLETIELLRRDVLRMIDNNPEFW